MVPGARRGRGGASEEDVGEAVYKEKDIEAGLLHGKTVGIVGFGNQGRAHALNLRDSGCDVLVALREGSPSLPKAEREGLRCVSFEELPSAADLISILIPDESIGPFFECNLAGRLQPRHCICFAHGFAWRYGQLRIPPSVDAVLVAPLGPGALLRERFLAGSGLPAYVAVGNDASGRARQLALSYAKAIGCAKAGLVETTFEEETDVDLFGEQAVLCGGLAWLVTRAFEVLVERGYSARVAYLECVSQLETLAALISRAGLDGMRESVSPTALYGELTRGPRIVDEGCKRRMAEILEEIASGRFAREWLQESRGGGARLKGLLREANSHPVVETGKEVRELLSGES